MTFWSTETWNESEVASTLITPYDPRRIKHCAYELGADRSYALAPEGKLVNAGKQEHIEIPPGHFALLMTEEKIRVPADMLALISIKASWKLRGLVNVSGFHVDPGFNGRLKFSVYNAGSQPLSIEPETPLFLIWYCKLDRSTADLYDGGHKLQNKITPDDLDKMKGIVASPAGLSSRMDEMEKKQIEQIHALRVEVEKLKSTWSYHWAILGAILGIFLTAVVGVLIKLFI